MRARGEDISSGKDCQTGLARVLEVTTINEGVYNQVFPESSDTVA